MDDQQKAMEPANFWDDPQTSKKPIDIVAFLSVYLSRWPFLLLLAAVGAAIGIAFALLLTPRFTSKAVFLPPAPQLSSSDSALSLLFKTPSTAIYSGMLMSDSVLSEVIDKTGLQAAFKSTDVEQARETLRTITQSTTDAAGFVTLQVTYKDPRLARDIARNFLTALANLNDRLAITEAAQHRALFQAQLEKAKNDLVASEVALKEAQEASGVISPESQIKSGLSAIDLTRADIRAKQVTLAALLKVETDQGPDVQRLRSEISAEQAQQAALEGSTSSSRGSGLSAKQAPSVGLRFVQLEREVKYNQVLFDVMAKQFENARLQESAAAPGVQVIDFPEVPLRKSWPNRKMLALAGAAIGIVLGLIVVAIAHRRRKAKAEPNPAAKVFQALAHPTLRP